MALRQIAAAALVTTICVATSAEAQNVPPPELTKAILEMDEAMFDAFNRGDLEGVMSLFDPAVEFFHDKEGLQTHAEIRKGLSSLFANPAAPRRELVTSSVRIFPIPKYGALMVAQHRFCHDENAQPVCGVFEFSHVWQLKDGKWRVTRALSYDH